MSTTEQVLRAAGAGLTELRMDEGGTGRSYLLLHASVGLDSVAGFAELLATQAKGRAALYAALLQELDRRDFTMVGNSIGGWNAAELALLYASRIAS